MDRDLFTARLTEAAEAARAFAQSLVVEELPTPSIFRVRLNQSYDGHPARPGEVRYPQDSDPERHRALRRCDAATAVNEMWRDGRVPEWVNVAVVGETGTATVIELVCCGRFTDDETRLYHAHEGVPPFHVLSPALPPERDGSPFSIHRHAECWDSADLMHLTRVADRVWSLDVRTDEFGLDTLPPLPNAEIIEVRPCASGPGALSAFARFPKLRGLRLHLVAPSSFHVSADDRLDALTDLTITNLPPRPWGHDAIADVAPALTSIHLTAQETLWLEGAFGPSVRDVSLAASTIAGPTRMPTHLDHLSIHLAHGTDHHVAGLLDGITQLTSLSLRGTPVSDAIMPALERYDLDSLDLVDTAVTASALSRFHAEHPETRLFPRTPPFQTSDHLNSGYGRP